nr:RagB/SusD family nutrient uptake outer membrane protein [Sunxiuqinia sp.]
TMENSVDGTNGKYIGYREDTYTKGRTVTGYYLRKFRDEAHTDLVTYLSTQTWVEIRLAEVYLNRAEANYRLGNTGPALADINAVRTRAGVGLPALSGITGDDLFAAIRKERKIELAYEGHLYWDMRRWKLADDEYNNYRVHGLRISKDAAGYLYEYVDCDLQDRKFLNKTYVFPIPYSELANNSAIEQYDEWK